MLHRRVRIAALLALTAAIVGCNVEQGGSGGKTKSSGSSAKKLSSGSVSIESVKLDEVDKAIEAKKGKVVVVDLWATW